MGGSMAPVMKIDSSSSSGSGSNPFFLYFFLFPVIVLSLIVLTFLQNLIQTVTVK